MSSPPRYDSAFTSMELPSTGLHLMYTPTELAHQTSALPDWLVFPSDPFDEIIPSTRSAFFCLPAELRNMVYSLLYGERRVIKIQSRGDFRRSEDVRKRMEKKAFKLTTFPENCLSHLLIGKQFFDEAAMIWTATKVFECKYALSVTECLRDPMSMDFQVLQHIAEIEFTSEILQLCESRHEHMAKLLPRLSRVTVSIAPNSIALVGNNGHDITACDEVFTEAQFASASYTGDLLKFRGLKRLTIRWVQCYEEESAEARLIVAKNKALLQALVTDVVTRAPETLPKRVKLPTFEQALSASVAAQRSKLLAQPPRLEYETINPAATIPPLRRHEIPTTEEELLRLVLLRPRATLSHFQEVKKAMNE